MVRRMLPMSTASARIALKRGRRASSKSGTSLLRRPVLRLLFVGYDAAEVELCLNELKHTQSLIDSDMVSTAMQFAERVDANSYDVILARYPTPNWWEAQTRASFDGKEKQIPIIYLTETLGREQVAELVSAGAAECIEIENVSHLPIAIRRALGEKELRGQRDRAEKKLRHSEAHYRALVGNLTYGMCRCGADGDFLDVNQALITMLGYETRAELLGVNLTGEIIGDPAKRKQLLGHYGEDDRQDVLEVEWAKKDGTFLRVRLSGREVKGAQRKKDGFEIIVEDVTKQRELENHLRQQAAKDPLTGLANYRQLVDVLDSEIKRSRRTKREFALLLFDLDHLKKINDRYGHLTGSHSLCRLADALSMGCRDIDTAARFGGDEFALVLPETEAEAAKSVADRIRHNFANDGGDPKLSVSTGMAGYPKDGETIECLLAAADVSLYAMKGRVHRPRAPILRLHHAIPRLS
jgi:diguanylate cyclase (GGDEF)-like protein/PAS domain S-box-containing protein